MSVLKLELRHDERRVRNSQVPAPFDQISTPNILSPRLQHLLSLLE